MQETNKQYKLISCGISTQRYHPGRRNKNPSSLGKKPSNIMKIQENDKFRKKFNPEHTKSDRCNKCGDFLHREGFRCPVTKHQCKICKKIGHFSSLCYKKRDIFETYQRSLGSPKALQLKVGMIYTQDSQSGQSEEYSGKENSFCLQLQVQSNQAETSFIAP